MGTMQASPFEQIAVYDAPEVILSQVINGTFSARGGYNAVFNPSALSPIERETYVQKMKTAAGRNPVTDTLIEVAMNPFVWLSFLTSPLGAEAAAGAARGAGGLYQVAAKYSPWVRKYGGMLHSLGAMHPNEILADTASSQAINEIPGIRTLLHAEEAHSLNASPLIEKLGLGKIPGDALNFETIKDPETAARVKRAMTAMYLKRVRAGEDTIRPIAGANVPVSALVDPARLDAAIGELGDAGASVLDGMDRAMKQRWIRVAGVDTPENLASLKFVADENKIAAMANGASKDRGILNAGLPKETLDRMFAGAIPDDMLEAVRAGDVSPTHFKNMVTAEIESRMDPNYFPRNTWEAVNSVDNGYASMPEQKLARGMRPTASISARQNPFEDFHPEDLNYIKKEFGATPQLEEMIRRAEGKLASGEPTRFLRLNPSKMLRRYFDDTSTTYSLFGAPVSEATLQTQKLNYDKLVAKGLLPEAQKGMPATFEKSILTGEASDIRSPFLDNKHAPNGRWTYSDVLFQDFVMAQDPYARNVMGKFILPSVVGVTDTKRQVTLAALMQAKKGFQSVLEGPLGDTMAKAHPMGEDFVSKAKAWAMSETTSADASGTAQEIAKYFYVTHQGLNPASMSINMLQPMLGASTQLGLANVLKGYGTAFKSMFGYISERAGQGFKAIGEADKMALIEKHFPMASFVDSTGRKVNLLGIGPNPFESVDGVSFGRGLADQQQSTSEKVFSYMMKGFEKTEWMNRAVTAEAVKHRWGELGMDFTQPATRAVFERDVRRAVQETQFASSVANTPLAFQSGDPAIGGPMGKVLSNPLGRQYLPFLLRSMTGQWAVGPRLNNSVRRWGITGMTTEGALAATAHDFLRMMGNSALVYEVGKASLNADLSRGLGANASVGVFGLDKAAQGDSPMFLPPAADIPMNLLVGFMSDDVLKIQQAIPRLIPGGIALSRLGGILPELPYLPSASGLQRTYADWKTKTPDGLVPMFKGDGTLIGYEEPRSLILRGLGMDLGSFTKAGQFDRFIQKNAQEISGARSQAIQSLLNGDNAGFESAKASFQKRFGMPLVFTKAQMQSAIKLRDVPRPERMIDRLPVDLRPQYLEMAAATDPSRFGISREQLMGGRSASARGARPSTVDPETLANLRAQLQHTDRMPETAREMAFTGFTGF
jgi:hypothetical protein